MVIFLRTDLNLNKYDNINKLIYIFKYASVYEPIEYRSILCELFNDVTIITARANCMTVALL